MALVDQLTLVLICNFILKKLILSKHVLIKTLGKSTFLFGSGLMKLLKTRSKAQWKTPYRVPIYSYKKDSRLNLWSFFKQKRKRIFIKKGRE
ncbi:hypothetical protein LS1_01672 [Ligilactobacillus salivarius]|nr:hypothetical protein LS1_01672 [Ligilactobacillus salivarius]